MLDICSDADAALLDLARERGLITAAVVEQVRVNRQRRSAAVALVEDGHMTAADVRALRTVQRRTTINHAIDGYRLLSKLGSGGMSEVFLAQDLVNGGKVAIKVISPRICDDRLFLDRFQREARAAAALVHPNIIACHGMGQTGGKPYMVLEYMDGGDVDALAARSGGALSEARAIRIAQDCAEGLKAVAAHGMVHRDIKPANIFLAGDGLAKLADLGLAKGTTVEDQLTMAGIRVGSPGYMSPEQAAGKELDIRSDIYSLGASLYHLLAGRAAFTGTNPMAIILKGLREDPVPLRSLAPQLSEPMAAIVAKCMARLPAQRFQHPSELLHALNALGRAFTERRADVTRHERSSRGQFSRLSSLLVQRCRSGVMAFRRWISTWLPLRTAHVVSPDQFPSTPHTARQHASTVIT